MKTLSLRGLPAVILLALTIVVSATTGAVAGNLITSADIKDNTIKSVDVHNGTLQPDDFSGAAHSSLQGPQGPQGPAGVSGVSGYERITFDTTVAANASNSSTATCPSGKKVLGGGGFFTSGYDGVQIVLNEGSVVTYGHNSSGSSNTLRAYAICANVS